jgi:hypothetical protein
MLSFFEATAVHQRLGLDHFADRGCRVCIHDGRHAVSTSHPGCFSVSVQLAPVSTPS